MRRSRALGAALAGVASAAVAAAAGPARAQTMLDQEERLIDLHALLLDLPPAGAPGAIRDRELSLGLEVIGIPDIDGTTGTKRQITASDRTPVFPRPRVALGLPAPVGLRAFAGLSYIPPVAVNEVSTHFGAAEAGVAWTPGPLRVGLRGHGAYARSRSPVTEPKIRDTLRSFALGADLSAGWQAGLPLAGSTVTPYAGVAVVRVDGRFRVTSDRVVLESRYTGVALNAGVRLLVRERWEAVAEVDAYPRRLVHPVFRVGYLLDLARR